ncbi:hypothetical protein [Bacillus cabrialesii]|uniref:Uncharacterized protein n=1 Tax=Bacillus cabrialesii subsp. tritici TaxID=2944916 RepID=A0ABT9DGZ7_9BACI|nr:hypothetical protein [Bacillus cabrialesii]MDO8223950.1 hypothetical protein [Bacillus cabrialesii subsp. tritici]
MKLIKVLSYIYPLIISGAVFIDFTYAVKNFDKVLDGAITFSSIVLGFLGALLGILISIKDSAIVSAIFESKEKNIKLFF